jgi:GNAT superfamily N-acetyltransferase
MEKSSISSVWEEYEKIFLNPSTFLNERNVEELKLDFSQGILEIAVMGEDTVKGFCLFYRDSPYTYHIDYLGVPDAFQGRGVGKRLLRDVMQTIYNNHKEIESIGLLCKDDKVQFYLKNGFMLDSIVNIQGHLWNKMMNKNV